MIQASGKWPDSRQDLGTREVEDWPGLTASCGQQETEGPEPGVLAEAGWNSLVLKTEI